MWLSVVVTAISSAMLRSYDYATEHHQHHRAINYKVDQVLTVRESTIFKYNNMQSRAVARLNTKYCTLTDCLNRACCTNVPSFNRQALHAVYSQAFPSNIMLYHWGDVKSVKTGLEKTLAAWTQIALEVEQGTNSWARFDKPSVPYLAPRYFEI